MNVKILILTISFMCLTFVKPYYGQPHARYISHLSPLNKSRFLQRYKAHLQGNKANNDRPIFIILYPGPAGRDIGSGRPQDYYKYDLQNIQTTQQPFNQVPDVDKKNKNEEASIIFPNDEEKYNRDYNSIDVRSD
ncbi:hypothetical protein RR46_05255 [Papilio xuthus]|uniref:Cuticular protein n=1 Tax=Papilio xuthus TaxID=66420 RepID=A0A194Q7L7_PAPXU|nr:hypothetical protein RR46_05255 [Papilio xuthus]